MHYVQISAQNPTSIKKQQECYKMVGIYWRQVTRAAFTCRPGCLPGSSSDTCCPRSASWCTCGPGCCGSPPTSRTRVALRGEKRNAIKLSYIISEKLPTPHALLLVIYIV